MRRKEKQFSSKKIPTRSSSHNYFNCSQNRTLAELNGVSIRNKQPRLSPSRPLRITLPDYFNIPQFQDQPLTKNGLSFQIEVIQMMRGQAEVRGKVKQLQVLAEGMRRAKSIKEESRYYFTEGVILHNAGMFQKSIAAFDKFLKIVLFLRDQKSVELALNAIGTQYLYLGNYSSISSFMQKLFITSNNREKDPALISQLVTLVKAFVINQAETTPKHQNITSKHSLTLSFQLQISLIHKLIERVQQKVDSPFLTEEVKNDPKEVIEKDMTRSQGKKLKESPIEQAIMKADSSILDYLASMRNSFIKEEK